MAAGDLTLKAMLVGVDAMSPVVVAMANTFDASIGTMGDATLVLNESLASTNGYLASLGDQVFTTGVGFDGMAASATAADTSLASVDASMAAVDTSAAAMDTSVTAADASLVRTAASADAAAASQRGAALSMESITGSYGMVKHAVELVGAAMAVIGVKMAGDFQQNITKLYTTAGEFKSNLQMVGDGILNMSSQVGTGAIKLSEAMYWIESGGLHGSQGLEALRVAAQAAKAENANLDKVSIALAASLNAYAGSGMSTVQVMNTLTAATGQGMMTFEGLSGSLASVLPAAAKFHVSLNNVTAALATMTAQGDPAEQAATHLKQLILALEAPAKAGASALKSVGLTSAEVAAEMQKSLPDALKMITDAVGKKFPEGSSAYNQAIKNIAGGSKQMMGFLELTGAHMSTFAANVETISSRVKAGGNNLMGWSDIQANFNFKLDQAKAALEAMAITIGTKLLPVLSPIVGGFASFIGSLTKLISGGGQLNPILSNITGMMGVLAGNFRDFGAQVGPLVSGPLTQFGQLMGSLLPGFISQFLRVINDVQLVFLDIAGAVATFVKPALSILGQVFKGAQGVIENALNTIEGQFIPALHNLITVIAPIIQGILQWIASSNILGIAFNVISTIVGIVIDVLSVLINILAAVINFFANTALGAAIFKAILVILAIAIGAIGIVILAVVIPAFIAWVAGAIAVGIANVIAFWPIILIILAIVAVVAVVILIIQHWGQIMAWLGGIFSVVGKFIGNVFSAMGTWIHNVLSAIGTDVGNFFSMIGTWIHARLVAAQNIVVNVWNGIKNAFSTALNWIVNLVKNIFSTIGGWFTWLYNHNYYIKALCDAIVGFFKGAISWIMNAWSGLASWFGNKTDQMRVQHEQKMVQMRINSDNQTAAMAKNAIHNLDVERTGILQKLKETHDPAQRMELEHQLKMNGMQLQNQEKRLQQAETDKQRQLAKQKELHDQMLESQKWFGQRFLDMVGSWLGNVFSAIGTWTHNVLSTIGTFFGNVFSALGTFTHNFLSTVGQWLGNVFSAIGTWFHNFFTPIGQFFGNVFSALGTFVHNFLSMVGSWFSALGTSVHNGLMAVFNFFGNIFSAIGTTVHNALTGLWSWITNFISGWPAQLFQAGVNLIQGFINGIGSMLGNLKNMLGNVAGAIGKFLGFHSPTEEGPGRYADRWAPAFINMYAAGLMAGIPQIQRAFNLLVTPQLGGRSLLSASGGISLGSGGSSNAFALGGGGNQTIVIQLQPQPIMLDNKKVGESVGQHVAKQVRLIGGIRSI